ncbi:hypothetical protein XCR_0812 [Xanthomonas campestris pv. raphani 756C]|nr:hypothetical protein XCR_0812 [Xanthomonas campestris pv. raphani 756C]
MDWFLAIPHHRRSLPANAIPLWLLAPWAGWRCAEFPAPWDSQKMNATQP